MAREFNGTNEYLEIDSAALTGVPISIACWFDSDSVGTNQVIVCLVDKARESQYMGLGAWGGSGGDPVYAFVRDNGATAGAYSTTGYSADTWHHVLGVFSAVDDRRIYLDGGSKGTNATSRTPTGLDRMSIGRLGDSSPSAYFNGGVAEVAIWNAALTDDEAAILAKGYSPLFVRPQSLVAYWPLIRDTDDDIVGSYNMTPTNGPTVAPHPAVLYPVSPQMGEQQPLGPVATGVFQMGAFKGAQRGVPATRMRRDYG